MILPNIISVYAPQSNLSDAKNGNFYDELRLVVAKKSYLRDIHPLRWLVWSRWQVQ